MAVGAAGPNGPRTASPAEMEAFLPENDCATTQFQPTVEPTASALQRNSNQSQHQRVLFAVDGADGPIGLIAAPLAATKESHQGQGRAPILRQRTEETNARESQHRRQDAPHSHAQFAEDGEAGMSGHYVAPAVDPEDPLTEGDTATLLLHCTEALLVKERESSLNPALDQTAPLTEAGVNGIPGRSRLCRAEKEALRQGQGPAQNQRPLMVEGLAKDTRLRPRQSPTHHALSMADGAVGRRGRRVV